MTDDALLLIGRDAANAGEVLATHAERIERQGAVDAAHVATYESEPVRELRDRLGSLSADRVYAVPMCAAHTYETTEDVPAALSYVPGEVRYCEPVGRSPAVTGALLDRATDEVRPGADASLVLVGFGNSSQPYGRRVVRYHAGRLRERSSYGEVTTAFLLQNPAVECARYAVTGDRPVAVPLFVARSDATEAAIPRKLELDRGGFGYADPLGRHPRVTRAVRSAIETRRAVARADRPASFEDALAASRRPVATDGEGAGPSPDDR
ncbi:MAG: CbiX/SirB N-terminal domain-containing protein [Haloferacaceae archaeon]